MRAVTTTLVVIVAVAFFGWQLVNLARLEAKGIHAEGQIVGLKEERHLNFSKSNSLAGYVDESNYHAIVTFHTQDNQAIEFEDFFGEYLPIFRPPGRSVNVLYLAGNPHNAIIDRGAFWNWVTLLVSTDIHFR